MVHEINSFITDFNRKLLHIEERILNLEKLILTESVKMTEGIIRGAIEREFKELNEDITKLRESISTINEKTLKWEGGGGMLYVLISLLGGLAGWILSHINLK